MVWYVSISTPARYTFLEQVQNQDSGKLLVYEEKFDSELD